MRIVETERIEDHLPRRLKAARALADLKVADVASACGWTADKVYRFERGAQVPDAVELHALAQVLGRPVSWLLGTSSDTNGADGTRSEPQLEGAVNPDDSKAAA
jgi:transcriptional regulator with XRE-family HTH domain